MKHPVDHRHAAIYHLGLLLYFGAGLIFHLVSAARHWAER